MPIPKIIYQTFKTTDLPWLTRLQIFIFRKKNPSYGYCFFDDTAIERFLEENYDIETVELYRRLNIGAAKADFFRYAILYKKGGIYLDIDSLIKKNLDGLILPQDEAIISRENNPPLYVQWALLFSPHHPFLKKTMEIMMDNLRNNRYPHDVHQMTGPTVYTQAIKECLAENSNISYREYGVDYGSFFKFKYLLNQLIYTNKAEHWRMKQVSTPVMKPISVSVKNSDALY